MLVLGVNKANTKVIVNKIQRSIDNAHFTTITHLNISSIFHVETGIDKVLFRDLVIIVSTIMLAFIVVMFFAFRSGFAILYISIIVILSLIIPNTF